ncbi:alpha/beta fold hydrolase [Tolypothrix bouteillei VB521301_2]|uniref:alpha/beta fold hydrolase n=1 Tax=Tolypothrix bouteillei TaxID=1246981 RepID=UPI0005135D39
MSQLSAIRFVQQHQLYISFQQYSLTLSLGTRPTLIVVGSHDFICSPLHAHRLHMGIANSKLILIEKAGHFPWLEQSEWFFNKVKEGLVAVL